MDWLLYSHCRKSKFCFSFVFVLSFWRNKMSLHLFLLSMERAAFLHSISMDRTPVSFGNTHRRSNPNCFLGTYCEAESLYLFQFLKIASSFISNWSIAKPCNFDHSGLSCDDNELDVHWNLHLRYKLYFKVMADCIINQYTLKHIQHLLRRDFMRAFFFFWSRLVLSPLLWFLGCFFILQHSIDPHQQKWKSALNTDLHLNINLWSYT